MQDKTAAPETKEAVSAIPGEIQPAGIHLEHVEGTVPAAKWDVLLQDAISGEQNEKRMSLREAIREYPNATFWSFAISLCIVMEGYDTSIIGGIFGLPVFRQRYGFYGGPEAGYQLTAGWQTAVGRANQVGNVFGLFIGTWFQEKFGYRRTLQVTLVFMTGFIFIVFFASSIQMLFAGELLCGLPWGAFISTAVAYASDVTPVPLRGYLTTYVNLCWVCGQFIAAGVNLGVQDRQDEWAYRIPFAVQWIWPIPLFLIAQFAPESPWWLVRAGRLEDAERSVKRLSQRNSTVDPQQVVAMMVRTNQLEIEHSKNATFRDCFRGTDLRRTEIAMMCWTCQALCGLASFGNSTYFFEQAGLATADAFKLGLGQYAIAICGNLLSWVIVTYTGRRRSFITGLAVMLTLLILIGALSAPSNKGNTGARWVQAVFVLLWIMTYDSTVGPLTFCLVGEASSTRLRGKTVAIARNTYNVFSISCGVINTYMQNPTAWNWKAYSAFFWTGSCAICLMWAIFRLPEFKGRSFRELDVLFEKNIPARKFKTTQVSIDTDETVDN